MIVSLLVATRSRGKFREIQELLGTISDLEYQFLGDRSDLPSVLEDGQAYEDNAKKKASEICEAIARLRTGGVGPLLVLADDSGLEVDALGGGPGIRSARYAGDDATDEEKNQKLLAELANVPWEARTARFRCVLALAEHANTGLVLKTTSGVCEGRLSLSARGVSGFGYDPLFIPEGETRTLAELGVARKNMLSHRAIAARSMARLLRERVESAL